MNAVLTNTEGKFITEQFKTWDASQRKVYAGKNNPIIRHVGSSSFWCKEDALKSMKFKSNKYKLETTKVKKKNAKTRNRALSFMFHSFIHVAFN